MTKLLTILICVLAGVGFAEQPSQPPPEVVDLTPAKPIVWDKFETATNTTGLTIGGKSIDTDGKITTVKIVKDHTVNLTAGKASVLGHNGAGQHNVPKDTFVAIASGYSHSVGLTDDGRVVCWGYAVHGQCRVPPEMGKAIAVAAGHSHTVALDEKGKVWAWGDNSEKQCDILPDLPVVVKIDATDNTSIAVDAKGVVYSWGGNAQPTKYEAK